MFIIFLVFLLEKGFMEGELEGKCVSGESEGKL
jgi:hypothetical protein